MHPNLVSVVTKNAFRIRADEAERYAPLIREAMIKQRERELPAERLQEIPSSIQDLIYAQLTTEYQRKAKIVMQAKADPRLTYDILRKLRDRGLIEQHPEDSTLWRLKQ